MLEPAHQTLPDGKRVRVARTGDGPPLVLTHGYPGNLRIFTRLADELADDFEVIAFDWPGLGGSEAWEGGAAPEQMADRLVALLEAWDRESVYLAGMDMGGQPALVATAEFPERIRKLAVMNSLVVGEESTSWEIALLRKFGFNRFALRHLPSVVFVRALWTFLPFGSSLTTEVRADLWRHFRRPEVREFVTRMCAGYEAALDRLPNYYEAIERPTLALWGAEDKHFPPTQGRRLAEMLKPASLEILPDGHHWMVWHRPEAVAEQLRAHFLGDEESPPGRA